ncbi:Protein Star [Gryllus bimaculatus]|nr:Protein Star [Gryllus bimaculatus]
MVSLLLSPGLPRRILPFAVFLTAFTVVMTILFLSFDLKAPKHRELFNFTRDLDFSSVGQDNPQFIAYVRAVHLQSPPNSVRVVEKFNINHQTLLVASILNNKITFRQISASDGGDDGLSNFTRVKCFPLYSLLLAAKMTEVDYLSLDADGAEVEVLKTLPLEHVDINIISVEKKVNKSDLMNFMTVHHYELIYELSDVYIFKMNRLELLSSPRASV